MIRFDFFKLKPRLGRVRYFSLVLFWNAIIAIVFSGILFFNPEDKLSNIIIPGGILLLLITIINVIFLQIRRLHDLNLKGWWLLLMLLPIVNLGMGLFLLFGPGSPNENRFGPPAPHPDRYDYMILILSLAALIGSMFFYESAITTVIEQKKAISLL